MGFDVLLGGAATQFAMILAVGPQNLFVISEGLRRRHAFPAAAVCSICDGCLILCGASLAGSLTTSPAIGSCFEGLSSAFLLLYGCASFRERIVNYCPKKEVRTLSRCILGALSVSLLNPNVYIDTVFAIGGGAASVSEMDRGWFLLGAILASVVWFVSLSLGAGVLSRHVSSSSLALYLQRTSGALLFVIGSVRMVRLTLDLQF